MTICIKVCRHLGCFSRITHTGFIYAFACLFWLREAIYPRISVLSVVVSTGYEMKRQKNVLTSSKGRIKWNVVEFVSICKQKGPNLLSSLDLISRCFLLLVQSDGSGEAICLEGNLVAYDWVHVIKWSCEHSGSSVARIYCRREDKHIFSMNWKQAGNHEVNWLENSSHRPDFTPNRGAPKSNSWKLWFSAA